MQCMILESISHSGHCTEESTQVVAIAVAQRLVSLSKQQPTAVPAKMQLARASIHDRGHSGTVEVSGRQDEK